MSKRIALLAPWRKQFMGELSEETCQLMHLANLDLHFGPRTVEDCEAWETYQGFESACERIRAALGELPSQLWVDGECEDNYTDVEPTWRDENDSSEDAEGEWADHWHVFDRTELRRCVVGKELSEYV